MIYGNKPADGGNLIIEDEDLEDFLMKDPKAKKYVHPLLGAQNISKEIGDGVVARGSRSRRT